MATEPASTSRRHLLKAMAGGLLASQASGARALLTAPTTPATQVGAIRLKDGQYALRRINAWTTPVSARCHGGCTTPSGDHVVVFERRPGWHFYVLDTENGGIRHTISAAQGEHFYGHGVFSNEGRWLYATANQYEAANGREAGTGLIAVHDAQLNFQRVKTFSLPGTGPHEIRLHPDDTTLLVALGGILTHPDYDRLKMNLDTMKPALLFVDRHSGDITGRFQPGHHQLSCRHLDLDSNGTVWVGYQFQGPDHQRPPLIGCYRRGEFHDVELPEAMLKQMNNYTASVAVCSSSGVAAVTAPRGGLVVFLDDRTDAVLSSVEIDDCAGVKADGKGQFLVTAGTGAIYQVSPRSGNARLLSTSPAQWDNHLI